MASTSDLPTLLAQFDQAAKALEREIDEARNEIKQANDRVLALRRDQDRLSQDIATAKARVQSETDAAARADRQKKLDALEARLAQLNARLFDEQARFTALQNQRREDGVQQRLEQERGRLLVACRASLRALTDNAVRYMVAVAALDAVAARRIKVEEFRSFSDQAAGQEILAELTAVRDKAADGDRQEAARFEGLRALIQTLSGSRSTFLAAKQETDRKRASLTARRDELQQSIAALEAPEPAENTKRRQLLAQIFLGVGGVLVVVGLALLAFGRGWLHGSVYLVSALVGVAGAGALYFAWTNTDHYRIWRLGRLRASLQWTEEQIRALEANAATATAQARNEVDRHDAELTRLGDGAERPASSFDDEDPFKAPLDEAERLHKQWREHHPEIGQLIP